MITIHRVVITPHFYVKYHKNNSFPPPFTFIVIKNNISLQKEKLIKYNLDLSPCFLYTVVNDETTIFHKKH